jgi:predicted nucleotidyltransferase
MDQVRKIVQLIDDVLGRTVIGIYLHGSAVLGGLKPASDLDVLVISRRGMDDRERRALLRRLLEVSGFVGGARPVELTVVVDSEVRPWRFPPIADFLFGEWLRDELELNGPPQPQPMPDLALLITMVLTGDRPLSGPPPAHLLDPVPRTDVVRASVEGIPGLLADLDGDTRNVVLTFARIWSTLATGEIRSKEDAADWALTRLPPEHRPALAHAKALYLCHRYFEDRWSDELKANARPYVKHLLGKIDRLSNR